jgi:hypothetical protein
LWLDIYDEGRRLERALHDVFHFGLAEGAMHSSSDDFVMKVGQDFIVVVGTRGMVGEDDGPSERWKFTHREAVAKVAGEERVA